MHKEKQRPITCIGAANVDRKAKIIDKVCLHSSNPVTSVTTCGGVSRNVAEYLGRLGCNTYLITSIGNDQEGKWITQVAEPFIDFRYVDIHLTENTGSYTAILDPTGDMVIGIADMGIYDTIDLTFMEKRWDQIVSSQCVVLDTNFPTEVLSYIVKRCHHEHISLCVVPGSGAKTHKIARNLQGISWLILNKEEAQILSGIPITSSRDVIKAADRLIEKGVKNVVITRGEEGVLYKSSFGEQGCITPPSIDVVDVTGAGDAFVSGLLYADSKGIELGKACKYGMSCSILALQTHETVHSQLNEELLIETYQYYFE